MKKKILIVAPFILALSLWMGTSIAVSAGRQAPPAVPVPGQLGPPEFAPGAEHWPEAADVARSLGISKAEAQKLIDRGKAHAAGLSEVKETPTNE